MILDKINKPNDIKDIPEDELYMLASEIRTMMIDTLSETGGHPVMWSHYSDDSSGFVGKYDANLLSNNLLTYLRHEYGGLSDSQFKVLGLHKTTYGLKKTVQKWFVAF